MKQFYRKSVLCALMAWACCTALWAAEPVELMYNISYTWDEATGELVYYPTTDVDTEM